MFPICQSVILSVIECRLDHTTLSLSSLFKHNSDIMNPWESLPEQQKDTPLQTRRYPLGLPTIVNRQEMEQVKALLRHKIPRICHMALSKKTIF